MADVGWGRPKLNFAPMPYGVIPPDFARPQASIKATPKSISGSIQATIAKTLAKAGVSERGANRFASRAMAPLTDVTPVGNVTGAEEGIGLLGQGWNKGNLRTGALGAAILAASVLPYGGKAKKPLKSLLSDTSGAIRAFHGGPAFEGDFDISRAGSGLGYADEPAVWFTPDFAEANRYAWSVGGGPFSGRPVSGSYYGKAVYPATIDDAGFDDIPPMDYDPEEFARIIAEARKANRPGIIFRSVREDDRLSTPADQIAVLDPSRIRF